MSKNIFGKASEDVFDKIKEYGESTERGELKFVLNQIRKKNPGEAAKYCLDREEYFENKQNNIYLSDSESQKVTDKQYVSTRLHHAIKKDNNLDDDFNVRTDTDLAPKQVGEKFYVYHDYMKNNEAKEEEIKAVVWSPEDRDWIYSNTELSTVEEILENADTYSLSSLDEVAEKIFKEKPMISSAMEDDSMKKTLSAPNLKV